MECVYSRPPSKDVNTPPDVTATEPAAEAQTLEQRPSPSVLPTRAAPWLGEGETRRLLELRLLGLFINQVSGTLPSSYQTDERQRWAVDAPNMALQHEPLLYAIFALTILYIVVNKTDVPFSTDELLMYRARYVEATLVQHRRALDQLTGDTADCITYTAALLSTDALACLRDRVLEPYEPPHSWLQMSQGTKSVSETTLGLVQGNPLSGVWSLHHSASIIWDPSAMRSAANRSRFPYLLQGFDATDDDTAADVDAYMDAVCFIAAADIAREAGEPHRVLARRINIFPCFVASRFVQLVTARKPRALVVLAHLFGLALIVSDHWFIGNTPFREIIALDRYLGPEWRDCMVWPMDMVQRQVNRG